MFKIFEINKYQIQNDDEFKIKKRIQETLNNINALRELVPSKENTFYFNLLEIERLIVDIELLGPLDCDLEKTAIGRDFIKYRNWYRETHFKNDITQKYLSVLADCRYEKEQIAFNQKYGIDQLYAQGHILYRRISITFDDSTFDNFADSLKIELKNFLYELPEIDDDNFLCIINSKAEELKKETEGLPDYDVWIQSEEANEEIAEKDLGNNWVLIIYRSGWELVYSDWRCHLKSDGTPDGRYNGFFIENTYTSEETKNILDKYKLMRNDFLLLKNQAPTGATLYKYYKEKDEWIAYTRTECSYSFNKFNESEYIDSTGKLSECETIKKLRYAMEHGDEFVEKFKKRKSLDTSGVN